MSQLPVASLKIEEIDTSKWLGMQEFFDKPMVRSLVYQEPAADPRDTRVLDCSFFSVVSADREKAIATLRRDLDFIKWMYPRIKVVGFLSKPSTLEIVTEPKPHEVADATITVDLTGSRPGKKKWAAFCFLFAYEDTGVKLGDRVGYKQLKPDDWKALGLPSAVREGEVGRDVGATALFTSVGEKAIDGSAPDTLGFGAADGSWEEDIDVSDLEPQLTSKEMEYVQQPYHDQKLSTLTASGETKPAKVLGALHPEISAAAEKHGVDLSAYPGRELQEMRKYFGSGTGLYLASVDFQTARVSATPLTEDAQKRILKVLQPKLVPNRKPKRKAKKPIKKPAKSLTWRRQTR